MARPVGACAEQTRGKILDSASLQFSELGLLGASVREIARGAGVSLGMVHHYFGSKDELYGACISSLDTELRAMREQLLEEIQRRGSLADTVARSVRVAFRFAHARQTSVRLLMRTIVERGELDPGRREGMQLPFLQETSDLLAAHTGQREEQLRLAIQSITFLVARYAMSSHTELAALTGNAGAPLPALLSQVEDHLASVSLALLGLKAPEPLQN